MQTPAELEAVEHLIRDLAAPYGGRTFTTGTHRSPFPAHEFLRVMRNVPSGMFLDVGCGIGTKLFLLQQLGWRRLYGIDVHAPFVRAARVLCPAAYVKVADAFEYDGFDQFDVVFMWWPLADEERELKLERHVITRMRRGAIAYFPESPSGFDVRTV